jgi:hypothetical protein
MAYLLMALQVIVGIAYLVCFILVLIKMFQNGQTGLGIACIVLVFCVGIGALIAFIFGWINAQKWGIKNIMMAWTACWVIGIILNIAGYAAGVSMVPATK